MPTRTYNRRSLPKNISIMEKEGVDYVVFRKRHKGNDIFLHIGPADEPGIFAKAEAKRGEILEKIRTGKLDLDPDELHLSVVKAADIFWEKYGKFKTASRSMFRRGVYFIKEYFPFKNLDQVTRHDVQGFRDWLEEKKGQCDESANKSHTVLTRMYNIFYEWSEEVHEFKGLVLPKRNPGELCPHVDTEYRARTRIVTPEEFDKFMSFAEMRTRRLLLGLTHSLLRQCDLKRLRKSVNIDRDRNCFVGFQKKTKRKKKFEPPITPEMWLLINSAEGDLILDYRNFQKEFDAARERADLGDIQPRDFRRTGARTMVREGADLATVQRYLGHTDISTTQRYVGASREDMQEASKILSGSYKWPSLPPPEPKLCASCKRQKADPWAGHGMCVFCAAVRLKRKWRPSSADGLKAVQARTWRPVVAAVKVVPNLVPGKSKNGASVDDFNAISDVDLNLGSKR